MFRNYFKIFVFSLFALALLALSCKTKKTIVSPIEKTAFYTLKLNRDTVKKETTFSVVSVQIADAKLKYRIDEKQTKNPNFLRIEITDKNKNIITAITEHPLFKRFDLYSESGEIESKSISLQQGESTFRVPYFSDYKKIKIIETINFIQSKQIIITNEK